MNELAATALVDTHCHFDLFADPMTVLEATERRGIYSIAVTNTPSVFEPMRQLACGLRYVRPAIGLHPELAIQRASELPLFRDLVTSTRYVGEVGLDYRTAVTPGERSQQRSIFETILRYCAEGGGKILTVHSRRAEADVLAALQEHAAGPFILHWYSGSLKTLRNAAAAGAYFSVNAAMIKSDRGQRLIREMPRSRVLTESDGPFVKFEGKPACPSSVSAVINGLAAVWSVDPDQAAADVLMNFRHLLGSLPGSSL